MLCTPLESHNLPVVPSFKFEGCFVRFFFSSSHLPIFWVLTCRFYSFGSRIPTIYTVGVGLTLAKQYEIPCGLNCETKLKAYNKG